MKQMVKIIPIKGDTKHVTCHFSNTTAHYLMEVVCKRADGKTTLRFCNRSENHSPADIYLVHTDGEAPWFKYEIFDQDNRRVIDF